MSCAGIHDLLDRYLDDELPEEQATAFTRHMRECPELADIAAKRTALRNRLREVVHNTAAPTGLDHKIRARLENGQSFWHTVWPVMAIAATLVLVLGAVMTWRNGAQDQDRYIASVAAGVSPMMQVGLKQHVHCAVLRKRPSQQPTAEEMTRSLGPQFADLLPAMQRHLPADFRVVEAHQCHYHGRGYTHLTATDGTRLISLLITNRAQGEALESDLRAVASEGGESLYSEVVESFNIAGFETRDHLIYLVSDLTGGQNLAAFDSMVPEIARTIRTHET